MAESQSHNAKSELCAYTLLENDIHEFKMIEGTREAADDYFDKVMKLYERAAQENPGQRVRILNDFSTVTLKVRMTYIYQKNKEIRAKRPAGIRGRVAILTPQSFLVPLAQMFMDILPKTGTDEMRLFVGDKRQEAIAWLLREESES
jgi:hypothetical protein